MRIPRRLTSWFVVDDVDDIARMRAARDLAVREAVHAELQVRDLCEALDAAESLLRQLDRMTAQLTAVKRGCLRRSPSSRRHHDPANLSHPAFG